MRASALTTVLILAASGCGASSHEVDRTCTDLDGDLHGEGPGCLGADCNDLDPTHFEDCDAGCAAAPLTPGCPCDDAPFGCFDGDPAQAGVGLCRAGLQRCADGFWSACLDMVPPAAQEVCDGQDEDCDGVVDDGVLNECGTCDADCTVEWIGQGHFDPDGASTGVGEDDDGALVVDPRSRPLARLWVPSGLDGTVSLVETDARRVVGRYRVTDDPDAERPSAVAAAPWAGVVVSVGATEGPSGGPTLAHIGLAPCPDTDGDGVVRTSAGPDDVLDLGDDDCVLWRQDLGRRVQAVAWESRLELDGRADYVWAADIEDDALVEVDVPLGEPTGRELSLPFQPAGVLILPDGRLVVVSAWPGSQVAFVDTVTLDLTLAGGHASSMQCAVATDEAGDVYVPNDLGSAKIDAETGMATALPECYGTVAATDRVIWGGWCEHELVSMNADFEDRQAWPLPDETGALANGLPWPAVTTSGELWVMDGRSDRVLLVDQATGDHQEVFTDIPGPGACGDATGLAVVRAGGDLVHYVRRFDGCAALTRWTRLLYSAETPVQTSIAFGVQVAQDEQHLAQAAVVRVGVAPTDGSPLALQPFFEDGGPTGAILLAHAWLVADGAATPRLLDLGVAHVCEP